MQLTGGQFTLSTALAGNDLATFPDFPAEIRAPQGTTFGVSAFQINFGSCAIDTAGDQPDVLIAMLIDEPRFAAIAGGHRLSWEDRSGHGQDYAETLKLWRQRFDAAVKRGRLHGFGDEFHRLWRYYLMYCEGGFRGGGIDVAQVTMVKS